MNPFVAGDVPAPAEIFVMLGVLLGAAFSAMILLFIGGEILSDPGGVQGALIVAAWLAAPLILSIVALLWPRVAYPILAIAVAFVVLAALAAIPFAQQVWDFEDTHGPISLLVILGALIPLVALGRAMPGRAGRLMVGLIVGAVVCQAISLGLVGEWSVILVFGVLMPPFIAVAVLFLVGGAQSRELS